MNRFDALVDQPLAWHLTAAHYIAAANYLVRADKLEDGWSSSGSGENWPVMLLYATAAENLLKAIRIAQGEAVVVDNRLARYFVSHNLTKYAADAGLTLSIDQDKLILKLQHMLEAGKYPVGTTPGRSALAWTWDNPDDVDAVWRLLQYFDGALRATGTKCLDAFEVAKLQYASAVEAPQNKEMKLTRSDG